MILFRGKAAVSMDASLTFGGVVVWSLLHFGGRINSRWGRQVNLAAGVPERFDSRTASSGTGIPDIGETGNGDLGTEALGTGDRGTGHFGGMKYPADSPPAWELQAASAEAVVSLTATVVFSRFPVNGSGCGGEPCLAKSPRGWNGGG
jgi:hypothetical protein